MVQIIPFPDKPWLLRVCSTSLLKTLSEKEKLLVTSNFSFSHSIFYLFEKLSAIFIKFEIVVCKLFQFEKGFSDRACVVTHDVFGSSQPSHITIVEAMASLERGTKPVAMTIINPRKEYLSSLGSNKRTPVLKSSPERYRMSHVGSVATE